MTACRYSGVPGHVCAGPVHLHLAGHLCEVAAPPAQPNPPAGTTLTDLQAARSGLPRQPEATIMTTSPDFGPQGEQVTALLAHARTLGDDQVQALLTAALAVTAARAVAQAAARKALGLNVAESIDAFARADRAGQQHDYHPLMRAAAAGWQTWRDYPTASTVLAWTLLAVAARHVIPAEAYAVLTGPWAQVVGRAHPDDVRTLEDSMFPAGVAR